MTPLRRRLFVLLGAYEDMTERETRALRRGDIEYVLAIQERKARLTDALGQARQSSELSSEETVSLQERLRHLQDCESRNLESLCEQMAQARQSLDGLGQAAQRSRKVRRGYSGISVGMRAAGESVLGVA